MKALLGWRYKRKPLGSLVKVNKAKKLLGKVLAEDISRFTALAINPAKHEYTNKSGGGPVFNFTDALYAHFLARHFGAVILEVVGVLDVIEMLEPVEGRRLQCFGGASFPISRD